MVQTVKRILGGLGLYGSLPQQKHREDFRRVGLFRGLSNRHRDVSNNHRELRNRNRKVSNRHRDEPSEN